MAGRSQPAPEYEVLIILILTLLHGGYPLRASERDSRSPTHWWGSSSRRSSFMTTANTVAVAPIESAVQGHWPRMTQYEVTTADPAAADKKSYLCPICFASSMKVSTTLSFPSPLFSALAATTLPLRVAAEDLPRHDLGEATLVVAVCALCARLIAFVALILSSSSSSSCAG